MRTTELHKLREERSRHLQQLDQLEKTKDLLEKANARVEDLTVQLATKTELERYVGNFTITKPQWAEEVFDKISGSRNKTYLGLISKLPEIQKCIA